MNSISVSDPETLYSPAKKQSITFNILKTYNALNSVIIGLIDQFVLTVIINWLRTVLSVQFLKE